MTYIDPLDITRESREVFLDWLVEQGLDPAQICADGLSVHRGYISGYRYLKGSDGYWLARKGKMVTVPFKVPQKTPLPELTWL